MVHKVDAWNFRGEVEHPRWRPPVGSWHEVGRFWRQVSAQTWTEGLWSLGQGKFTPWPWGLPRRGSSSRCLCLMQTPVDVRSVICLLSFPSCSLPELSDEALMENTWQKGLALYRVIVISGVRPQMYSQTYTSQSRINWPAWQTRVFFSFCYKTAWLYTFSPHPSTKIHLLYKQTWEICHLEWLMIFAKKVRNFEFISETTGWHPRKSLCFRRWTQLLYFEKLMCLSMYHCVLKVYTNIPFLKKKIFVKRKYVSYYSAKRE